MKKFIIIVLIVNQALLLHASDETIKIEDFSYKDGLNTSGVFSAYKDSKGFLWLCTINGLFRFDGYNFRNINSIVKNYHNSEAFCVTEDKKNNFWIGTAKGIVYYDSHLDRLYPVSLNINRNFMCNKIVIIHDKIWIASNIGLLYFKKPADFNQEDIHEASILLPDSLQKRTPQDNRINTLLHFDGSNSLWVGTNGALYELNLQNLKFKCFESNLRNSIRGLSVYNKKIIASSWDGGVFCVDPQTFKIENDYFLNEVNKTIGNIRVMSALLDKQNRLWVATYGSGLYIFELNANKIISHKNFRNNKHQQDDLKSDFINQLYLDDTGIVWLCMNQPALSKIYFQKNNLHYFHFYKTNDEAKEILSINQSLDKNKLWISTNGDGIYLFNTKNNNYKQFTNKSTKGLKLQENEVSHCFQDSKGNLWIVYRRIGFFFVPFDKALNLLEDNPGSVTEPLDANSLLSPDNKANSYITRFYEDSRNRIWLGSWAALYVIEPKSANSKIYDSKDLISNIKVTCIFSEITQLDFSISPVLSIVEVKNNQFLIGMFGTGIVQVDESPGNLYSCKKLEVNKKLSSSGLKYICKTKKENFWIGTNSGLFYWDPDSDNVKTVTVKNGLSSENINNIVEDNNSNIWVSTPYGISKISSNDHSVQSFLQYEIEKLNQYIENAGVITSENKICFSTNESLVLFNPDSLETYRQNAPLYFTDFKIDNQLVCPLEKYNGTVVINANINECKSINVPYNHTLIIEFAALDFINSDRLLYQYKIGNNNDWIFLKSNQRNINLPNLKHGEYTLNIRLANSTSEKNNLSIKINYLPPFWLSKTALAIYFIILIIIFLIYRKIAFERMLQQTMIENERYERKKLEELDKMKTEFFSNISHEFRTPLTLIINPLEKLTTDENLSEKNKEKISLILKSSNRLLKLTNELMDFSKLEKNLINPELQLCEIVSFLDPIFKLFDNLADSLNIDYKQNYSFEQLEIPVDKGMIEKVVFNLLSNAFKYTPINGTIMVNLSVQYNVDGEFLKISVINTGEGINKIELDRIFDRYYQVNTPQNRLIDGTGIGLSVVKRFVELHRGKVEVRSEQNVETCFDVYLPVKQENYQVVEKNDLAGVIKGSDSENKIKENKTTYHYRLLIIEDEDDIRNYIVNELSANFKIATAKNGEEGVRIANEMIPDLIITDVLMPVLSGIELCRILKNQLITSHIPIIILSAKTTIAEQIEGLEMGADIYMIKPFNIEHLKTQIIRLIQFKEQVYSRYLKETTLVQKNSLTTKLDEEFMKKVISFIETNLNDVNLNVEQLAKCVKMSNMQTYRKVKAISGQSIVEFIRTIRLKKAAEMVIEKKLSFAEIAYETGFSTPSYFTKCFHDHFGKTPSEYASDYGKELI